MIIFCFCVFVSFFLILLIFSKKTKHTHEISSDYNILITGGRLGLGYQLTLIFAKKYKCNLIIFDINDEGLDILGNLSPVKFLNNFLENKVKEFGANIHFFKCDVSNLEEVTKNIDNISSKFKHIDILINNAGIAQGKLFEDETLENIEKTLSIF